MIKVYHPSAWKANYPAKPRFWLSIADCLRDNPDLTERQVSSTPYIGPQTPEFLVMEAPAKALAETKAILDAAPVPTEGRSMVTTEGEFIAPVLTPEVPFPVVTEAPSVAPVEASATPAPEAVPEPIKLTAAQKRAATLAAKKAASAST